MASQRNGYKQVGRLKSCNFLHLDKEFDNMKSRFDNEKKNFPVNSNFGSFYGLNKSVKPNAKYEFCKGGFDAEIREIEKIVKSR